MIHRVQHDLRDLRAGGVVEKDESWRAGQRRKSGAKAFHGKLRVDADGTSGLRIPWELACKLVLLIGSEEARRKTSIAQLILGCKGASRVGFALGGKSKSF